MTDSYGLDPVKAKTREEIYRFADEHLPKDRSQASALYLAAANDQETTLLDRLGIPRANRIILEGNPNKVEVVRAANPDIFVLGMTTHDFLAHEAQKYPPFWYVGLDYECQYNDRVNSDITSISDNERMLDGGIFYINVVGAREGRERKEDYLEHFFRYGSTKKLVKKIFGYSYDITSNFKEISEQVRKDGTYQEITGKKIDEPLTPEEADRLFDKLVGLAERRAINALPPEKLDLLRSFALSSVIHSVTMNREEVLFLDLYSPGGKNIARQHGESLPLRVPAFAEISGTFFSKDSEKFEIYPLEMQAEMLVPRKYLYSRPENIRQVVNDLHRNTFFYYARGNLKILPVIFEHAVTTGYVPITSASFSYVSNKGTKMMLDLVKTKGIGSRIRPTLEKLTQEFGIYYTKDSPLLVKLPKNGLLRDDGSSGLITQLRKESIQHGYDIEKELGYLLPLSPFLEGKYIPIRKNLNVINGTLHQDSVSKAKLERSNQLEKNEGYPANLIHRDVYRNMSQISKLRVDYFIQDRIETLPERRQSKVREAFVKSNLRKMMDPEMDPYRVFYFFDIVSDALLRKKSITPEFLNSTYEHVRDLPELVSLVPHNTIKRIKKRPAPGPSKQIKDEIRTLAKDGFTAEDLWIEFGKHFDSRRQFGAVLAWAHPSFDQIKK